MDLGKAYSKVQYFERNELKHHRDFIRSQNNCVLCGTVLELRHLAHIDPQSPEPSIKEEAFCAHCDLRTRAKTHVVN